MQKRLDALAVFDNGLYLGRSGQAVVAHESGSAELFEQLIVDAAVGAPCGLGIVFRSGTSTFALLVHAGLEALFVDGDVCVGANLLGDFNREAVCVMQREGDGAVEHRALELLESVGEVRLALAKRDAETLLLRENDAFDELAIIDDLGIHMAHETHDGIHVVAQECALDTELVRVHDGAAKQAAQHVAAAFVGGQDAVGDHEGDAAAMVGNDAQR